MIASSAFFVLDGILDWPVALYDGSWSQWGQMAALNGGKLSADSRWRTDAASRSENIVYNYTTDPGPVFYTAATTTSVQVNDMTASGVFTASTNTATRSYRVQIDTANTPNTFKWSQDGGKSWVASGIAITGTDQALGTEGMLVSFTTTTGHTVGDKWDFVTQRPVEVLSLNGSSCSSKLNFDGSVEYSPAGCTPQEPNSTESGNQLEEEDAAYFGAGGGNGSGGGPVAPGY